MFYIGDKVFYPCFGVGVVINIEEKEVYEKVQKYYIIKLLNGIITMVPVESQNMKIIRKCIDEKKCREALEIFKEEGKSLPKKWVDRYKIYIKAIKRGDAFEMCYTLNDILFLKKKKTLSKSEEKIFLEILDMVSQEIGIVLNTSIDKVKSGIIKEE